jgi:hypothetical protein
VLTAFEAEQGDLFTYRIILGSPRLKFYNVIFDPGNGKILETQEVSHKELDKMHKEHSAMIVCNNGHDGGTISNFPYMIPD